MDPQIAYADIMIHPGELHGGGMLELTFGLAPSQLNKAYRNIAGPITPQCLSFA